MSMLIASGAALTYSGLAAISYTINRHYANIHGRGAEPASRTRRNFRLLGWLAIVLSFAACISADGWHTGPVLWCGMFTASAIVLALLLHYAPHKAILSAGICYPAAIIASAWGLLPS
jgi:hypothetical protein